MTKRGGNGNMNENLQPVLLFNQPATIGPLVLGEDVREGEGIKQQLEIGTEWTSDWLTDNLPMVFFIVNRQRKIVWWNKRLEIVTGLSKNKLTQFPIHTFFPQDERNAISRVIDQAFSEGSAEIESWIMTKNDRRLSLFIKMDRTEIQKKPYLTGLGIEVNSVKNTRDESEQYRMLLQAVANQSDTVIFVKDNEGKYLLVNPKFKKVLQLRDEQIIGKTDFDLFDKTHAEVLRQDDVKVSEQKKPHKFEEQIDTPQGKRYYLTSKFPLVGIPGLEQGVCGIATEITRYKEKEDRIRSQQKAITQLATETALSEETLDVKLSTITRVSAETLKVARVNIWLLEDDKLRCISSYDSGHINSAKDEVLNMTEYPDYYKEIKASREIAIEDARQDKRSRKLTESYLIPHDIYSLLDTSVHISKSVTLLVCHEAVGEKRNWKQDEISFVGAIADQVAQVMAKEEREAREMEIRESLKEKEILLSEIHHRVKNNLAVVSSLLQLQAFEETNEEVRAKLTDSVMRIQTMATIHEQLYQSHSFSNMDFSENIRKLITNIIETYRLTIPVEADFRLQPIRLNVNQAIPCSLIINEVVTNALKHAFTDKEEGKIVCELSQDNNQITVIVKDNGVGLPENFDPASQKSLGFLLIEVLAQQLDAEYEFFPANGGCEFMLRFEISRGKKSISDAHIG